MKSIKEKAFELFPEMHTDSEEWDIIEEQCDRDDQRKAFVLGANYVLDTIQSCIDRHEDGCLALEAIILTIDELKR